jgi:hypothetical protein
MAEQKERPILFSAPMVRALLEGRKTQTRRLIKDAPIERGGYLCTKLITFANEKQVRGIMPDICPYGKHGDRLWVRETFAIESTAEYDGMLDEGADSIPGDARDGRPTRRHVINADEDGAEVAAWYTVPRYRATEPDTLLMIKEAEEPEDQMVWTPSIFMPRWASRITLEITEVRVQRLQDISEEDAKAEGCEPWEFGPEQTMTSGERGADSPYRGGYACLWDEINGDKATWKSNPWVWAITFKVVR